MEIQQINTYLTQKYVTSLESITVSDPTKTQYEIGDELDLTGLVVTAHYSDGSEATVEDYEVSGFRFLHRGRKDHHRDLSGQNHDLYGEREGSRACSDLGIHHGERPDQD